MCIDNKVVPARIGSGGEAEALITSLAEDRSAEAENIKRKEEIKSNTVSLKTDVSNAITDIGTDWDEDRVITIDVGKEASENIRVLTEGLSNAQVNVEKAENALVQEKRNKEESSREFQAFSHNLETLKPESRLKYLLIFGMPFVVILGILFWTTLKPISGIIVVILGFIAIAFYYFYYKIPKSYPDESKEQLPDILGARKKSIGEAEKALSNAKDEYQRALEKWQGWLRDNGFSTEMDRNGIFDLIESVRKARELIRKKEEAEKKLQHVEERAHTYLGRVNDALKLCNLKTTSLDNISQSIHKLNDTLKKQKELKEKKEHLEERIRELETRGKTIQDIINDLENSIRNLIVEGGAGNAEEFRKHSNVVQERESLLKRKKTLKYNSQG